MICPAALVLPPVWRVSAQSEGVLPLPTTDRNFRLSMTTLTAREPEGSSSKRIATGGAAEGADELTPGAPEPTGPTSRGGAALSAGAAVSGAVVTGGAGAPAQAAASTPATASQAGHQQFIRSA